MTAQGEDILAWLDNAITVREEAARAVGMDCFGLHTWPWGATHLVEFSGAQRFVGAELDEELVKHVVLHDPESVLRRCAADRKLLAIHNVPALVYPDSSARADDRRCVGCGFDSHEEPMVDDVNDCPTLNALAEGYGWAGGER
jgi:hypothetical protein